MKTMRVTFAAVATLSFVSAATVAADLPPRAKPEEVGMSSERLALIGETVKTEIASEQLPGAVLAIARRGKLVYFETFGHRDKAAGAPMAADAIFNIASMTKPMTAVAALQLYERGALLMTDPVAKYFPKFADMQVAVMDAKRETIIDRVPAARPITIRDLFVHTSGMPYGSRGTTGVHKMYPDLSKAMTGSEFIDKLASAPLLYQPGTVWDYGYGLDVLGLIVESIAEQSLGQYLDGHVWKPLGMTDTGFSTVAEKGARYARALPNDPITGRPQPSEARSSAVKFDCGGGCAASTASDYLRFALMLMNGGKYRDTRILGRKTVEYMLSNQIGPDVKNLIVNADPTRADYGFGLGLAVRATAGIVPLMGSVGEFNWPGATGTNWWADPREELVVVWMAYSPGPIRWKYRQMINALVYQAIVD
jgi:CubicO group peptidase (beta-lactamase class C family)